MTILYTPPCESDKNFAFPQIFHIYLKVNGCWPTDGDTDDFWFQCKRILYTIWGWIFFGNLIFSVYCELSYFFDNMTDVAKAVESLSTSMIGVMVILRTLHIRFSSRKFKKLFSLFADKIWINGKQHPHIIKRCHQNMKPIFGISLMLWTVLILYSLMPIVVFFSSHQTMDSTDKGFPYRMIFPYDAQKGWRYFVTYVGAFFAGYMTVSQFYSLDALMTMFLCYLCGQFEILHGSIARLVPECHAEWLRRYGGGSGINGGTTTFNIRLLQDVYTKRLHELCVFHSDLISFSIQLNEVISFPLWVNIINSTFLICFCGFQFVVSTDTAWYLYMCNWEGGHISKHSPLLLKQDDMELETLSVKLPLWQYINYYPADKDFKHKLRFMIMRSQRPVQLNAMKFTILSLESFSKIISSSMSYFALLKTFLDKQK